MHYPASDIPKQARELYKINRIRILHDRDDETARLVGTFTCSPTPQIPHHLLQLECVTDAHHRYAEVKRISNAPWISLVHTYAQSLQYT
jgi:light-regulated signal transduction histidine kinase (bacteriophytochrome)